MRVVLLLVLSCTATAWVRVNVSIEDGFERVLGERFVSIGLDAALVREGWCGFNMSRAILLAKALAPAFLRFGGNDADRMRFAPQSGHSERSTFCDVIHTPKTTNFSITESDIDKLFELTNSANWSLIYDLNALLRDDKDRWSPSNALKLLNYTAGKQLRMDFELGNEPNSFHHKYNFTVTPKRLAADYGRLRAILQRFDLYRSSFVIGPSITQPDKHSKIQFLRRFLKNGGIGQVSAVTFHQYYLNGRTATLGQFLDPRTQDSLVAEIRLATRMADRYSGQRRFPTWLGESASAFGGGAPRLSDTYASGFLWLDKLGVSAREGLDVVVRQSFYRGHYALLDNTTSPNPDYWLTLLFKKLVGSYVRRVRVSVCDPQLQRYIRVYAHDSDQGTTVYGINLSNETAVLQFNGLREGQLIGRYLLQPKGGNLQSKEVLLNGKPLHFDGRAVATSFQADWSRTAVLPARRLGFFRLRRSSSVAAA